jgi:cytochrome c oxidase subunit II
MNVVNMHMLADFFLPDPASNLAGDVDRAWNLILLVTGFFFCVVVGAMTYFVIRYRRRTPNDETSPITHNTPLEIAWTAVPLVLVIVFFYVGFKGFVNYDTPRSDCVIVDVVGQKWSFTFTYPNGASAPNLYVVKDQPVRLNMHSIDVLHALYLPNFRTQRNLVPYRQTSIWFVPTQYTPRDEISKNPQTGKMEVAKEGGFPIYCTQYCGNGHSQMRARIYVLSQTEFDEKMKELANPFKRKEGSKSAWVPYWEVGQRLYSELGCKSCHSTDGTAGTGPTWKGLWKRPHEFAFIQPGSVGVDAAGHYTLGPDDSDEKWESYLRESMIDPDAKLVRFEGKDYHGMTSFAAQLSGSAANVEKSRALVEFIKSLKPDYGKPDATTDAYDADKHPQNHPESLAARQAATAAQPGPQ